MAQAWVGTIPGTRITVVRPSATTRDDAGTAVVPWAAKLVGASLLAGLVLAVLTLLVVPRVTAEVRRPFTPGQFEAVIEKEEARVALTRDMSPGPAANLSALPSGEDQRPRTLVTNGVSGMPVWTANDPESAQGPFLPYQYEGPFDPPDMTSPNELTNRSDAINLFFGGVGSSWDVSWNMTHQVYGDVIAPSRYYPGEEDYWQEKPCTPGQQTPVVDPLIDDKVKYAFINGEWKPEAIDLHSRDIYVSIAGSQYPCRNKSDAHQFHMRGWDGGWNSYDGYWSVGAAHWDPADHNDGSSRYDEAELLVVKTFTIGGDENGPYRWFVQDVWSFPLSNNELKKCIGVPPDQPCERGDGEAHYVQFFA